jgi:hypothetical protein
MLSVAALGGAAYSVLEAQTSGAAVQLALVAVLVLPIAANHLDNEGREFVHLVRYGHTLSHDAEVGHDAPPIDRQVARVATVINRMRRENGTLFTWELTPWLFQMLDIKSPVHVLDLGFRHQLAGERRRRYVDGVLAELKSRPATFVVDSTEYPETEKHTDPGYARFADFVAVNYEPIDVLRIGRDTFRIYRLHTELAHRAP